jgi:hypothetical protein
MIRLPADGVIWRFNKRDIRSIVKLVLPLTSIATSLFHGLAEHSQILLPEI